MSRRYLLQAASVLAAVILAAWVMLAGAGGRASASTAGAAADLCYFQVYEHSNFRGDWTCFGSAGGNLGSLNNKISSIYNFFNFTMCAYEFWDRGGYSLPVGGRGYFRNLAKDAAPDGGNWNDRISSAGPCRL